MVSQAVDNLLLDQCIFQSELMVTRQRMRVGRIERAGNDSSLSRSLLQNFETALRLQYANRDRVRRQLQAERIIFGGKRPRY